MKRLIVLLFISAIAGCFAWTMIASAQNTAKAHSANCLQFRYNVEISINIFFRRKLEPKTAHPGACIDNDRSKR